MKILFDQGTPVPLRDALSRHEIVTAFERGWQTLQNGEMLTAPEAEGYEAFVTTDKNIRRQQNPGVRRIAIVVLPTTDWRRIRAHTDVVAQALDTISSGVYVELSFPKP